MAREDRLRIIAAIDQFKTNPAAGGVLKGEFSGLRRIRIGNYRVVYEVQDQKLVVLAIRIRHRRKAVDAHVGGCRCRQPVAHGAGGSG